MSDQTTIDIYVPDEVESAAWEVISAMMPELTFVYADQNKHRPPMPYGTIKIIGRQAIGSPQIGALDDEGYQTYHQINEGTVSVRFYGGAAKGHASNLQTRMKKITSHDIMRKHSFFLFGQPEMLDMTTLRDDVYFEPGAMIDIQWRFSGRFTDFAGIIEKVVADGTIGGKQVELTIDVKTPGV